MAKKTAFSRKDTSVPKEYIAYKYCGTPDAEQTVQLNKTFGCVRWLYNQMVWADRFAYEHFKESVFFSPAWYKHLSNARWLKEVDSLALANVQMNYSKTHSDFLKGNSGKPQYRKKSDHYDSYTTNAVNGNISFHAKGRNGFLTLPKVKGEIRLTAHRNVRDGGKLKSVTVSREPDGKYYFSLLYEYEKQDAVHEIDPGNVIGLDMSMHDFYVDSNGYTADFGKPYRNTEARIVREQRKLARMTKKSNNYEKQRRKLARLHAKTKHQRQDFLHKESHRLVTTYDIIGIEDLNMRGMAQSLNFGKSVSDKGWGMFITYMAYKAERAGKKLIKVDRFFPSSQMCHECGALSRKTKDLSVREWTCPHCGHHHQRDENAALNIRDEAVRIYCTA